jgi:thiol:disulfide interchange protein DsbA
MMRKISKLFLIVLLGLASAPALATEWKEGVHYNEIPFPLTVETGDKIEVREFFWYGCPHCYHLEPTLVQWLKTKPKAAEFVRSPAILGSSWEIHALAYFTYEALGVVDKMHQATFDAIHEDKRVLRTPEDLADFAAKHGIDRKKFLRASKSFGVNLKMKRQLQLDRDAGIRSVPAIVIDGKYRTGEDLAGSRDNLVKLMNHLVSKAQKERRRK